MTEKDITTITPFLTVNNGKKAVDFYISAFGGIEITRYEKSDEKLTSQISIEGATFWVGGEEPAFGNISPGLQSDTPVRIILKTKNADELFKKALTFGATEICPMTTEEWWRIGKLKDPFGHVWEIGYPLQDR
jgi:PhnB protein